MAAIVLATTSDSLSGSVSTGASAFTSLSVFFPAVLVGYQLVPWSSDQPVCFLVSLAPPLVACQPMHQKVIWPGHLRSVSAINSDCVSQRVERCFGLHIPQSVANTFNLYLWKSVSPCIDQCLSFNFVLCVKTQVSFFSRKSVSFCFDQCLAIHTG